MLCLQAAGAEENHPDVDNHIDHIDDDQQHVPNVQKSSSKGKKLSNLLNKNKMWNIFRVGTAL